MTQTKHFGQSIVIETVVANEFSMPAKRHQNAQKPETDDRVWTDRIYNAMGASFCHDGISFLTRSIFLVVAT